MYQNIVLTNFIDLSDEKKLIVLNWRNNFKIRQWMHTSDIISAKNHYEFIATLEKDDTKQYYLVSVNNIDIGVIYFININPRLKTSKFGIYSNPELLEVGSTLLYNICVHGFNHLKVNTLIAEVHQKNSKAIHLYNKFNFKKKSKTSMDSTGVICMELKHENW